VEDLSWANSLSEVSGDGSPSQGAEESHQLYVEPILKAESLTAASMRLYNTPYSVVRAYGGAILDEIIEDVYPEQPFDLKESMKVDDIPDSEQVLYANCKTPMSYEAEKQRVADIKLLDSAEWYKKVVPGLVAGISDPINWLQVGVAYKAGKWTGAITDAVVTAGISAEVRYATQAGMTQEDVAVETVASGVVTGAIGGIAKGVKFVGSRKVTQEATENISNYLKGYCDDAKLVIKDSDIYQSVNGKVSKVGGFLADYVKCSPYLKGVLSDCADFRDIMTSILRSNQIITPEVRAGKVQRQSLQSGMAFDDNTFKGVEKEIHSIYRTVFKETGVSEDKFMQEVMDATGGYEVSSGYAKTAGKLITDCVQKRLDEASRFIEKDFKLTNPVSIETKVLTAKEAQYSEEQIIKLAKKELLSDTKIVANQYVPRVYLSDKILENQAEFESLARKSLLADNPALSETEIKKRIDEIVTHCRASFDNTTGEVVLPNFQDMLKHRTVGIHDEILRPFLAQNPIEVWGNFYRKLSYYDNSRRVLKDLGHDNWGELIEQYKVKRQGDMPKDWSFDKKKVYDEDTGKNVKDIEDTLKIIAGQYGKFSNPNMHKMMNSMRTFNCMRHLGSVVVSSLCDVTALVGKFGFGKTIKGLAEEFFPGGIADKQGWSRVLHATEVEMGSSRLFGNTFQMHEEKAMSKLAKKFNKATLLPYWNDYLKSVAGRLHYGDILEAVMESTEKGNLFLRQQRLDNFDIKAIRDAFSKYGYKEDGNYVLGLDNLVGTETFKKVFNSINTLAHETVITVSAGDVPKFLSSHKGKAFLQYKSFQFAYFNNVVVPQLLQKESRDYTVDYLLTTLGVAPAVTCLKYLVHGSNKEIGGKEFIKDSIGISTVLGPFHDAAELFEDAVEGAELGRMERLIARASPMLGLAFDTFYSCVGIKNYLQGESVSTRQRMAIRGMIPLNNWFLTSRLTRNYIVGQRKAKKKGHFKGGNI